MGTTTVFFPLRRAVVPSRAKYFTEPTQANSPHQSQRYLPTGNQQQQQKTTKQIKSMGIGSLLLPTEALAVALVRLCPSCFRFHMRLMLTLPTPND